MCAHTIGRGIGGQQTPSPPRRTIPKPPLFAQAACVNPTPPATLHPYWRRDRGLGGELPRKLQQCNGRWGGASYARNPRLSPTTRHATCTGVEGGVDPAPTAPLVCISWGWSVGAPATTHLPDSYPPTTALQPQPPICGPVHVGGAKSCTTIGCSTPGVACVDIHIAGRALSFPPHHTFTGGVIEATMRRTEKKWWVDMQCWNSYSTCRRSASSIPAHAGRTHTKQRLWRHVHRHS
jgi:hypothetical protein